MSSFGIENPPVGHVPMGGSVRGSYMTRLVVFRWEDGCATTTWDVDDDGWLEVEAAIQWVKAKAGYDYGDTIVEVSLQQTKARGGDTVGTKAVLSDLALQTRYTTGEGCYEEDCPIFFKYGIQRS